MSKFKVGDRVRVIKNNGFCNTIGKCGTVIVINGSAKNIGIELDESFCYGHSLDNRCKNGYGRWYEEDCIELIERTQPIVIYRKGQEVIALDKNTNKRAVAKCHPDDEFNFSTGAKLAFGRLFNEEPDNKKIDEIKIGDAVQVVNPDAAYSNFCTWSGLFVGEMNYRCSFIYGKRPIIGNRYKVVNKEKHDLFDRILYLYLIRDLETGQVFIIEGYGIKKI